MNRVNQINLNHLKIFTLVYRYKNMTQAAKELHLTQSGISQHIKTLEDNLDIKLFDRDKQRIIPTSMANVLYDKCNRGLEELEKVLKSLSKSQKELHGLIKIATPDEFGLNVIIPIVNEVLTKNPGLQVEYHFSLVDIAQRLVYDGEIDFAFVDGYESNNKVVTEKVYEEFHILCASDSYLKDKPKVQNSLEFYEQLKFIDYIPEAPYLAKWLEHHTSMTPRVFSNVDIVATCPIASGVYRMIKQGLGAGILPLHFIENLPKAEQTKLVILNGSGKPLKSPISLIRSAVRTSSIAADFMISELKKALQSKKSE